MYVVLLATYQVCLMPPYQELLKFSIIENIIKYKKNVLISPKLMFNVFGPFSYLSSMHYAIHMNY